MREVEISRIAQQKASNPKVKEFANMMVQQHTKKNQQLHALAASKRVSINNTTAVGAGSSTTGSFSGTSSLGGAQKAGGINDRTSTNLSGSTQMGVSTPGLSSGTTNNTTWNSGKSANNSANHMGNMSSSTSLNTSVSPGTNELNNLNGAEFDRKYLEIMIRDHEQAVDLFTRAMQSNDKQVKALATKTLPALRAHLYDAKKLNNSLSW